jgi:hypothetical protein
VEIKILIGPRHVPLVEVLTKLREQGSWIGLEDRIPEADIATGAQYHQRGEHDEQQ